MADFVLR